MDQISGTTPTDAQIEAQDAGISTSPSGFGARGRARRRARFLRKARELAYRDLGGLVFNLHRFGQRNDALVMAKLTTLAHIDTELRTLEAGLGERNAVTVLREAGITACARCAAIHSSEDRFCPNCGLSMGRHPDLPIAGAAPTPTATPGTAAAPAPQAPAPAPARPVPAPQAPAPATAQYAPATAQHMPAAAPAPAPAPAPDPAPAGNRATPAAAGRSPTPPPSPEAPEGPSAAPPAQDTPGADGQDEPTEILRPPAASS
ncbi:MAG TPA: hypothetical protein VES97_02940 [Solirubrobacteraceae bacterium]|nr:hypothetical protein [Solirubrobacteraceae bacterium]